MRRSRARPRSGPRPAARTESRPFDPEILDRAVIAVPLLRWFEKAKRGELFPIVIDLNLNHRGGVEGAREVVVRRIEAILAKRRGKAKGMSLVPPDEKLRGDDLQYVFATLDPAAIKECAHHDSRAPMEKRAIHHIWPDFPLKALINKTISTVKADAAHSAFAGGIL